MGDAEELNPKFQELKHDLKNPLYVAKNLIQTHLEYLEEAGSEHPGIRDAKSKAVLQKSLKQIDRALGVLSKLHRIARDGRTPGTGNGSSRGISIQETLFRVLTALREGRYLENLIVAQSIPSDLPPAEVDPIDLEEIFFNLITNAAQATLGGGRLMIAVLFEKKPVPSVSISFRDTGHGISEEFLPYIFEPFCTSRSEEDGVGFGLYIVKQLVERNGGQIRVESQEAFGTTFTLSFPVPSAVKLAA